MEVVLPVTTLKPLLLVLDASATWLLERDDAGHPRDKETAAIPFVTVPWGEESE